MVSILARGMICSRSVAWPLLRTESTLQAGLHACVATVAGVEEKNISATLLHSSPLPSVAEEIYPATAATLLQLPVNRLYKLAHIVAASLLHICYRWRR